MNERIDVPFFRPLIGDDEIAEVVDSLRSGWLTTGPKVERFEREFSEYLGGGIEAVAVNSATAALHLSLEAAGIGPGDQVICPTMTFTATAEVIRYMGAEPIFVDCEPDTLNICPDALKTAVTEHTKAVMPVHFAGLPCDMPRIWTLAEGHGLRVIEDAAHALPACVDGALIGAGQSVATAFSFYANKTITTGEGGMLASVDPEIAARARTMRLHGIDRDVFARFGDIRQSWRYDVIAPGYKYNMTDMAAALGIHQLRQCSKFHEMRAALAKQYDKRLADLPIELPAKPRGGSTHAWHLYVIRVGDRSPMSRDELMGRMREEGIFCSVHYRPLHMMSYWRGHCGLQESDFPNATRAFEQILSLPLFAGMTECEQNAVVSALHRYLG